MLYGQCAHHFKAIIVIFSNNIYNTDMMTHSGHISETRCFRCVVVKLHPLFLRMVHADCKHATVTTYSADYADVPKHAGNNNCDTSKQCIFQCNEQQSIGWRNCEIALHSSHTKVN